MPLDTGCQSTALARTPMVIIGIKVKTPEHMSFAAYSHGIANLSCICKDKPYQRSSTEVSSHERCLVPTTSNCKSHKCRKRVFLQVGLLQSPSSPMTCHKALQGSVHCTLLEYAVSKTYPKCSTARYQLRRLLTR